jgi:hypothetical protein
VLAAAVVLIALAGLGSRADAADDAAAGIPVWIEGPPGARLTLDDRVVGRFPLAGPMRLAPGRYRLVAELAGYRDYQDMLRITGEDQEIRLRVRLVRLSRTTAVTSNLLLAGLGQHYTGHAVRGYLYNAAEVVGLLAAIAGEAARVNHRDDYLVLRDRYDTAINPDAIERYRAAAQQAYSEMDDARTLRNSGLALAVGAIAVSMLDAWLFFPEVAAVPGPVSPPSAAASGFAAPMGDDPGFHVRVTLRF